MVSSSPLAQHDAHRADLASGQDLRPRLGGQLTTFALVHGGWHGSWCWSRLAPLLEAAGHRAVAVDLPCEDPRATFGDYADVVVQALEDVPDQAVLVGHSFAGFTVPLVAARLDVKHIVYLCSLLPAPGLTFAERRRSAPDMLMPQALTGLELLDAEGTTRWVDVELARARLYGDCDPATARWAFDRLRAQAATGYHEPWPLEAFPDVRSTYVVCEDDRVVSPQWSRRAAAEEIGASVVDLPGGHSPFLSRPQELAAVLLRVQQDTS